MHHQMNMGKYVPNGAMPNQGFGVQGEMMGMPS
jgi:hypothetical protein